MNKQGPGKIDWADWTWNPISGCLHGCPYCYMLRMEKRFPGIMKPVFHQSRIDKFLRARKIKPWDKVFVGSSAYMWGDWVPGQWITDVLNVAACKSNIIFQFLTKNPKNYNNWAYSKNCWLGTTVDGTDRTKHNLEKLVECAPKSQIRFVSFEPMLDYVDPDLRGIDWVIIGADSTRGADRPLMTWANNIIYRARYNNIPVWMKDNYGYPEKIKEWPGKG